MTTSKSKLILNGFLILLFAYSIFLLIDLPQPYGKISIAILIIGFAFNFFKKQKVRLTIFSLAVAGSSFCLFAGTQFMLDNIQKRKLFDLDTAVTFEKGSFDEVLKKAQQLNKPVFIDFYTAWCGSCLDFSRNVLTDEEVGEQMNAAFLNFKIDAEKGEGIALAKKYNIHSYPSLIIVDAQGELLEDINKDTWIPNREKMIENANRYISK